MKGLGIRIKSVSHLFFSVFERNRSVWILFFIFSFSLFLKGMLFHIYCFHSVLLSSLFHHPLEFFRFWGGKVVPVFFLSSFVFVARNKIWTIGIHILIDIWLIANMFYFNANGLFLSLETMKLVDNLTGFWDSLFVFFRWQMLLYPIITLLYGLCLLYFKRMLFKRKPLLFCLTLTLSLLIAVVDNLCFRVIYKTWSVNDEIMGVIASNIMERQDFVYFFPFGHVYFHACIDQWNDDDYNSWARNYIKDYSIISYFPSCFLWNFIRLPGQIIKLSDSDIQKIRPLCNENGENDSCLPKTNIIFILVESLESWSLNEVCGYTFMPHLRSLSQRSDVLFCDKVKSQVRHGNSADGQMIALTGLLPIANGVVAMLYDNNFFPSYSMFSATAVVNPAPGVWNQTKMTRAYHFKTLIEPQKHQLWDDSQVIEQLINYIDTAPEPFCVLGLTIASHAPFSKGQFSPVYVIDGMPPVLSAYLNSLHYTDSLIGILLGRIRENERLSKNSTIVISGDHVVFRNVQESIDVFANEHHVDMQGHQFVPLIIRSPMLSSHIDVTDTCYQMDIYPTILSLIGCQTPMWKGVGVNLLDATARQNRLINEQEAYRISEAIIRSDYFNNYYQSRPMEE